MKAVELTGIVDENQKLQIDGKVPIRGPKHVRVILLYPMEDDDIGEQEWLYAAARNPAFDFLREPSEDIYTVDEGRPFHDEI
ncbi:MAG: hypothetical protein GXP42_02490 [Chloroflexi bacterium]|nr:hypothetical protein [Chloroflexota bacterium]